MLVDHEHGLVSRQIFVDDEIYALELERIFARCWLYLAHESQLSEPGDYITTHMGEDSVVVCRTRSGQLDAYLNLCPGCSSVLCRADQGQIEHFRCRLHRWEFTLDGLPVLGADQAHPASEAAGDWGLMRVAQLANYQGCIFGTFDPEAPPLADYLGDIRWGLELLFAQADLRVAGVTRWLIDCNWKFAAENAVNDVTADLVQAARQTAAASVQGRDNATATASVPPGFTVVTEYGHGLNAEWSDEAGLDEADPLQAWRGSPAVQGRLGSFRMRVRRSNLTVFPNLAASSALRQLHVWHPRGPTQVEAVLITLTGADEPDEVRRAFARTTQLLSGPAGIPGQDEFEAWTQCTRACRSRLSEHQWLNYQMGLEHGELVDDERTPARIESLLNEHRQLWFYRNWAHALQAPDWQQWRRTRPRLPARM
jgi:phenylpropionate dioxygenase-like ring-hydroxylating dioxygenase large terminal subunit